MSIEYSLFLRYQGILLYFSIKHHVHLLNFRETE